LRSLMYTNVTLVNLGLPLLRRFVYDAH